MRITYTHIFFYGGSFSNWCHCKIVDPITGLSFGSSEQAFMWYKANFFGDIEIANKILKTFDPQEAKRLGRSVRGYDNVAWGTVRYGFMVYVNQLKFRQNLDLRGELIATYPTKLVEASPTDRIWGIGLDESDDLIFDERNWKGENLLGKALGEVRNICIGDLFEQQQNL